MKLSQVKAKIIDGTSRQTVEKDLNDFLQNVVGGGVVPSERQLVAICYQATGTLYSCLVLYTE